MFCLVTGFRTEETSTENRDVADEGNLFERVGLAVIEQAADGEALPLAEFDLRVQPARVVSAGTLNPLTERPFVKSSALTSGATCNCMVPRGVIVGVKVSRTPNSRNWMDTVGAPPLAEPLTLGNGNCPSPQGSCPVSPFWARHVWLGKYLQEAFVFERLDGSSKVQVRPKEEYIEGVRDGGNNRRARLHDGGAGR